MPSLSFPPGFLWGCAASAYQIEGALTEDGRGLANWDVFCRQAGRIAGGQNAETACDHYHRMKEDADLLAELGAKAYRFSVAWPRVVPGGVGPVNGRGLDFYDRLVDALLERGVTPFAALYHWDHPQALDERGGWLNPDFPSWFSDYAAAVARRLSDRVTHWLTLNEPPCISDLGYKTGWHAPGLRLPERQVNQVAHHVMLAHGKGVRALRENARRRPSVGLAHNAENRVPLTPEDGEAARAAWRRANAWWFHPMFKGEYPADLWREKGADAPAVKDGDLKEIAQPLDFVGLNVYHGIRVRRRAGGFEELPFLDGLPRTEMDWPVIPEALYWGFKFFQEEYPAEALYVAENGAAFADAPDGRGVVDDRARIDYLAAHLRQAHRAVEEGLPVRGYFAWTLLDNFEWAQGYGKKFGLVRVHGAELARTPKASFRWYRDVIARNAV